METLCEKEPSSPTIKAGRVYLITNLINSKGYVGVTVQTLKERWHQHTNKSKPIQRRSALHNSIRKYGKENFKIELIEECFDITEKELLAKETFYIDKYDTFIDGGGGYNLVRQNTQKLFYSQFTREKMSKSKSGEKNQFYGKLHTIESKKMMSQAHLGIHHTKATKKKIGEAFKREKSPNFNSTIRKFRNANTGEEFVGVQYDFIRKYNLKGPSVIGIINGKRKTLHGWTFVSEA